MSGDEIVDRGCAAAIGHLLELDAGNGREPLHHHVLGANATAGRVAQPGLRFGERDHLGKRGHAQRRVCREHDGLARELDDRGQCLQRLDVHLVDVRVAAHGVGRNQHRIAVRRAPGRSLDADIAVGAGLVLDHDLLVQAA